jgi:hypothetical protein
MAHGDSPASEYAQAAWRQPKPLTRVVNLRCTVVAARASDHGVFRCLGVRARAGYGGHDVAARGRRRARERRLPDSFHLALFKLNFLQKFKQESSKL